MPIQVRYLKKIACIGSVLFIVLIFVVPSQYRLALMMSLPLFWLVLVTIYYKQYHAGLEDLKMYDQEEMYEVLLTHYEAMNGRGYTSFVYDSYAIYALYVLGRWHDYRKLACHMKEARTYKRPKMENFRKQVNDNLCCIAFLEKWADDGSLVYDGENILLRQSIQDYHDHNRQAIISRLVTYDNQPPLKKACLYSLAGKFDEAIALYPQSEATTILEKIKERESNG